MCYFKDFKKLSHIHLLLIHYNVSADADMCAARAALNHYDGVVKLHY